MKEVRITLVKSFIGRPERQKETVKSLGLGKLNSQAILSYEIKKATVLFRLRRQSVNKEGKCLEIGCWILEIRNWMLEIGNWKLGK